MANLSDFEDDFHDAHDVFDKMSDSEDEGFVYDSWVGNLDSVDKRRNKFIRSIGLSNKWVVKEDGNEPECEKSEEIEPVLDYDDAVFNRQPSLSCWSNAALGLGQSSSLREGEDEKLNQSFEFGSSSRKESDNGTLLDRRNKVKRGWLQKLNIMARITDHCQMDVTSARSKVNVHTNKKKSKELSSVYATQDFAAHNGYISVLKFSHDGRYLASAGDDGVVRIWEVSEQDDPTHSGIQVKDPSSRYFSTNHLSELAPIKVDGEKTRKIKKLSDLTCVILPPKVIRILEKPVHEFHGHTGEILSLSWSRKGYLLSSSVDKTVRLWQIGHSECLKVFAHNNYVTCVEFNPVDENHFISGSIDGKVRIWEVKRGQVVDWVDNREIVTAVCYYTNGKGFIVGTLDGNCSFYDIIDKQVHLDTHICVMSKKKWPRQITGFQFCPTDSRKVIVSSADSQVRVLCGINVVGKFKGNRSSGSQMSASFTSDGKHIVSAGDDSNIYMWNHLTSDKLYKKAKSNFSCESFLSHNASVAIPWSGMKTIAGAFPSPRITNPTTPRSSIKSPRKPSLTTSSSFLLDTFLKSPTHPTETLPDSTQVSVSPSMRKSEYRFLRRAYRSTFVAPHTWGLVIVSAGLDGRIRTYVNYGLPTRI